MGEGTAKVVLLIDRDPEVIHVIREMFSDQDPYAFDVSHVHTLEASDRHLAEHPVDVILLDSALAYASGLDPVSGTRAAAPKVPIVLMCSEQEEQAASEQLREAVQGYLVKDQFTRNELLRTVRNALLRKHIQESQFADMDRARVTLNAIGDGVICTDKDGNISYLNPTAETMIGQFLREVRGRPLTEAFHIIDAGTGLTAPNPMKLAVGDDLPAKLPANCILMRQDGTQIYIEDSVAPIHDSHGMHAGFVLVFRDVTAARTLTARLAHLAEHDALTGMPNRLLLTDRLGQAIARAARDGSMVAVLFLDLDGFKHVNDSLGHRTGDEFLKSVAKSLLECVRHADTVSRLGGDEFVVLLSAVHRLKYPAITARRILNAVGKSHLIAGHDLRITASIGVSVFPDDGLDAETLIKNADTAMYQAKEAGKQTFKFFKSAMNVIAVKRQAIEEDLRGALERNELTLHYQPKIHLKSGAITGVEALLRWLHPTRGNIPPLEFIPIAEACGLMPTLGTWVLRQACHQAKAWADSSLPRITMAVNVSLLQFRQEGFLKQMKAILTETALDPKLLEIEVTESVLMQHPDLATRIFHTLRDWGIHVAIDDFGTGYSCLSYLGTLPLDALKIDQSFIRQISTPPKQQAIVCAIIHMARSLGLRVIAEGVQTAEEVAFLKKEKCHEAQGAFYSMALPPDRLASMLGAGASSIHPVRRARPKSPLRQGLSPEGSMVKFINRLSG
jgi:diguanylate cyclase (GGDEF)-like protein